MAEAFFDTAAAASVPTLVDQDDLVVANGRRSASELATNELAGPSLGGLLAATATWVPIAGAAAAYAATVAPVASVRGSFRPAAEEGQDTPPRWWSDIRDGMALLLGDRALRVLLVCVCVANAAGAMTFAVLPLHALDPGPLGLSKTAYGFLIAALGLGGLLGATLSDRWSRRLGISNLLVVATVTMGIDSLALATTNKVAVVVPALVVGSMGAAAFGVVFTTTIQRLVPDRALGRVNAGVRIVALVGMPVGGLLAGALGDIFDDLRPGFALAAATFVLLSLLRLRLPDLRHTDQPQQPDQPASPL